MIRQATRNDAPALLPLMQALGYALGADELRNSIAEINQRGGAVFVAEREGRIVGCVAAIIDVRLAEGVTGEIVSLVVVPECRGLGIGKGLVEQAEAWLDPRVSVIRIRANAIRAEAHGFYRSLGFKEIKTQKIFVRHR